GEVARLARAHHQHAALVGKRIGDGNEQLDVSRLRAVDRGRRQSPGDPDRFDALAAPDQNIGRTGRRRRQRVEAMQQQRLLPRPAGRRLAVQHLQIVDAVERGIAEHRALPSLVAAAEDHGVPPETKVCTWVTSLSRSEYATVTRSVPSSAEAVTDSTFT